MSDPTFDSKDGVERWSNALLKAALSSSPKTDQQLLVSDDPIELLSRKCRARASHHVSGRVSLLYHFEKMGEEHEPYWLCLLTVDRPRPHMEIPEQKSRVHRLVSVKNLKKSAAQEEVALRALSSWDEQDEKSIFNEGDDAILRLDRRLVTLEQAAAVYQLSPIRSRSGDRAGNSGRHLWKCRAQLTIRPRRAQMTMGTISSEEAAAGEFPETVAQV